MSAMTGDSDSSIGAVFIAAPRHPRLQELYTCWETLRGGRAMPSRTDIDPTRIPKLLPHIILYNVGGPGAYTIRLVGESVQSFVGQNATGRPAGWVMDRRAAETMILILDAVVTERAPKFRIGKAHWHQDKSYREFEACFLPLSTDGVAVNIILGAVTFAK
jgi:hypothetical protein